MFSKIERYEGSLKGLMMMDLKLFASCQRESMKFMDCQHISSLTIILLILDTVLKVESESCLFSKFEVTNKGCHYEPWHNAVKEET